MQTEMINNIQAVKNGTQTIREIAQERLARLEKENPRVNAIVEYHPEELLRQAGQLDTLAAEGKAGCLAGAILTVKDNLDVCGMKSTAGLLKLKDQVAASDSSVVGKLRAAGALILGKTNMPPAAMDVQTDNPVYGRTHHPDFTDHTCGGSSGGGACAVKLGISDLDIGNDLLGSIRIPAHFCGVFGLIATEGAIRNSGLAGTNPMGSTLSSMLKIGVQSRDLENISFVLPLLAQAGFPLMNEAPASRLKIAWSDHCGELPLSEESQRCIKGFRERVSAHHECSELNPAAYDFDAARECFTKLLYGGVAASLPPALCWVSKTFFGQKFLNNRLKDYLTAENTRERLKVQLDDLLQQYDCLITPVTATSAFLHQKPERMLGIQPIYSQFSYEGIHSLYATANLGYTTPFMTGHPIVSMPVGRTSAGLPIGVQVICARFFDYKLLRIIEALKEFTQA